MPSRISAKPSVVKVISKLKSGQTFQTAMISCMQVVLARAQRSFINQRICDAAGKYGCRLVLCFGLSREFLPPSIFQEVLSTAVQSASWLLTFVFPVMPAWEAGAYAKII